MLLLCDRVTPTDLSLWKRYEEADVIVGHEVDKNKSLKSMDIINKFIEDGECYFSTSWGKDSVVMLHLGYRLLGNNMKVWNIRVIPNRNSYCDIVRDKFLGRFNVSYNEMVCDYTDIIRSNLTLYEYNIATDKIWYNAIGKIRDSCGMVKHCLGIRSDESNVRLLRCLKYGNCTKYSCAPIAWWKATDVFGYLNYYDLPIHPNYAMLGGGRYNRDHIRVSELGDSHGRGIGRNEWEREYYSDFLRRCGYVNN
jgi:phosphoadenosine phosphosulfate reductase